MSLDLYSTLLTACIREAPMGKTAMLFLEQSILLNWIPRVSRTDKRTAFTGTYFRLVQCANIELEYGTPYILHTVTGLVEIGKNTKILNENISRRRM